MSLVPRPPPEQQKLARLGQAFLSCSHEGGLPMDHYVLLAMALGRLARDVTVYPSPFVDGVQGKSCQGHGQS